MRFIFAACAVLLTLICVQLAYEAERIPAIVFGVLAGISAICFICAAFIDAYEITERDPREK